MSPADRVVVDWKISEYELVDDDEASHIDNDNNDNDSVNKTIMLMVEVLVLLLCTVISLCLYVCRAQTM